MSERPSIPSDMKAFNRALIADPADLHRIADAVGVRLPIQPV